MQARYDDFKLLPSTAAEMLHQFVRSAMTPSIGGVRSLLIDSLICLPWAPASRTPPQPITHPLSSHHKYNLLGVLGA